MLGDDEIFEVVELIFDRLDNEIDGTSARLHGYRVQASLEFRWQFESENLAVP